MGKEGSDGSGWATKFRWGGAGRQGVDGEFRRGESGRRENSRKVDGGVTKRDVG